jgi:hypothetical protein
VVMCPDYVLMCASVCYAPHVRMCDARCRTWNMLRLFSCQLWLGLVRGAVQLHWMRGHRFVLAILCALAFCVLRIGRSSQTVFAGALLNFGPVYYRRT